MRRLRSLAVRDDGKEEDITYNSWETPQPSPQAQPPLQTQSLFGPRSHHPRTATPPASPKKRQPRKRTTPLIPRFKPSPTTVCRPGYTSTGCWVPHPCGFLQGWDNQTPDKTHSGSEYSGSDHAQL